MNEKQTEGMTRRINEVDDFLRVARQTWTGRLVSSSYGLYGEKSLFMSTHLKNEVLDVIERYRKELKEELERVIQEDGN
ncbi:MAG TPA: hypothetical protein VFC79_03345 [Tissierellaceae bacterium]|nr:hypothetical protein [Tissierellaceae bacterium]